MMRTEKSVFISYRRTNFPWAMAIFQSLRGDGFDVFLDYEGIAVGDFESVILENVRTRSHFLILLTPSALERCDEPGDWLRREIEIAMASKRNIVPLMLEGFTFSTPSIASKLTGTLAPLSRYQAIGVPNEYFLAAMEKLRRRLHDVRLDAITHPPTNVAVQAAAEQVAAAAEAPKVSENELLAQQYFEQAYAMSDPDEKIRLNTEAIRLKPDYSEAYNNRGIARKNKGDIEGALSDYSESIRLRPDYSEPYNNRGIARKIKSDIDGALSDYSESIRLRPDYGKTYYNRGIAHGSKGDMDSAVFDYSEALRLKPDDSDVYYNRGIAREAKGDVDGAVLDYSEALRLKPDDSDAYYNRGKARDAKGDVSGAITDFRKYLETGGGERDGDTAEVQEMIAELESRQPKDS